MVGLSTFLEYFFYLTDISKQSEELSSFSESTPPLKFRYEALVAIAKANNWDQPSNDLLFNLNMIKEDTESLKLINALLTNSKLFREVKLIDSKELRGLAYGLVEWRKAIWKYKNHFINHLAVPSGFGYMYQYYEDTLDSLMMKESSIDEVLTCLMNYESKSISDLKKGYGYPEGDVDELDLDCM